MDVTMYIGGHRTGTTTFQSYMRHNSDLLRSRQIAFWGPKYTRRGLFSGIQSADARSIGRNTQARALGRVRMQLDKAAQSDVKTLVVSDENICGSVRANLRARSLYPGVGERLARLAPAFQGHLKRVVLNVRGQDSYWGSCAAYGVARGHPMLRAVAFADMAANRRTWRDVVTDVACALPGVDIIVQPYERFGGQPDAMLRCGAGCAAPEDRLGEWLNRAPSAPQLRALLRARAIATPELDGIEGRWQPFDPDQLAKLKEDYADDMFWLTAGADGLATLTQDKVQTRAGQIPPAGDTQKGHGHEHQERHMAQPG